MGSSDESDEVKILRWIASPGASVKKSEALLEVKINVKVAAPEEATLGEISANVGDFVKFGAVIAVIEK